MTENFEGKESGSPAADKELVIKVFSQLAFLVSDRPVRYFTPDKEISFIIDKNPAGNISIDDVRSHETYLLWEDGELEAIDSKGEAAQSPSNERLHEIMELVQNTKQEEL